MEDVLLRSTGQGGGVVGHHINPVNNDTIPVVVLVQNIIFKLNEELDILASAHTMHADLEIVRVTDVVSGVLIFGLNFLIQYPTPEAKRHVMSLISRFKSYPDLAVTVFDQAKKIKEVYQIQD